MGYPWDREASGCKYPSYPYSTWMVKSTPQSKCYAITHVKKRVYWTTSSTASGIGGSAMASSISSLPRTPSTDSPSCAGARPNDSSGGGSRGSAGTGAVCKALSYCPVDIFMQAQYSRQKVLYGEVLPASIHSYPWPRKTANHVLQALTNRASMAVTPKLIWVHVPRIM
jgi:hypothetical protein